MTSESVPRFDNKRSLYSHKVFASVAKLAETTIHIRIIWTDYSNRRRTSLLAKIKTIP